VAFAASFLGFLTSLRLFMPLAMSVSCVARRRGVRPL
jgi:hypothetical protein